MINIGVIKNISRVKKCSRGSIITGDGLANILFIILKGEVGVYTNYRLPGADMIATLGSGELFADPGLLQDKRAAYTTVALSESIIVPVDRNSINDFILDEPALSFELIKDLYLRLDKSGAAVKEAGVQNGAQNPHDQKPDDKQDGKKQKASKDETAAAPSAVSDTSIDRGKFTLFPEGHGSYELLINNDDTEHLMNKSHTCPICKGTFTSLTVKPSKLVLASTDGDMRSRYKGIEPLYYEVLTCPHCLYSALPDVFEIPDKSKPDIARELEAIKDTVVVRQDAGRDPDSVFASFYLALFCAPISYSKYQLIAGKLLYKLSRVYQDAGDEKMELETASKALENYLYAYEKIGISPLQEQQICILIGELYLKQGDLKNAVAFFSKAKSSKSSSPVLKNHAESRVYDIREMAAASR